MWTGAMFWWNNSFFRHMWQFFLDFIAQTLQKVRIILAVDCFSFLKLIIWKFSTYISKNWRHELASSWNCHHLLYSRFSSFILLFWLSFVSNDIWTHISSIVMNKTQKLSLIVMKHSIETSSRCFCSIMSKRLFYAQLSHIQIVSEYAIYCTFWKAHHIC